MTTADRPQSPWQQHLDTLPPDERARLEADLERFAPILARLIASAYKRKRAARAKEETDDGR